MRWAHACDAAVRHEGEGDTNLGWAFEVYARGRLFTVAMRFFSLVACCA